MRDFVGNELQVGDYLAAMDKRYANLMVVRITRFTPKACRAIEKNDISPGLFQTWQVVKMEGDIVTAWVLKNGPIDLNDS